MKKILVICGHPDKNSLNYTLAQTYVQTAKANFDVEFLHLRSLEFNMNLEHGYNQRTELEPDLIHAQKLIEKAEHIVWFYPTWWGSYPAVMKGFIDRVFLPGFAFNYKKDSPWWDKLLQGKTCRIVTSMHTPYWYYKLFFKAPSIRSLKQVTMQFCGVKRVRTTVFTSTQNKKKLDKSHWIQKVATLGKNGL